MSAVFLRRFAILTLLLSGVAGIFALIVYENDLTDFPGLHHGLRLALVALLLSLWFYTQSLLALRVRENGEIGDILHDLTASWHRWLVGPPQATDRLLIVSSAFVDMAGVFVLLLGIFGPGMRPLVALTLLYVMRQVCQKLCSLPPPPGLIWRYPGFPSLLVTYKVGNDFFFSGHTAVSALAAVELARISPALGATGAVIVALEVLVVVTLRAHYTMDVFAALTATACAVAGADWVCTALAL